MSKYRTYAPRGCEHDDVYVGRLETYLVFVGDRWNGKNESLGYIQAYCVRDALADARAKYGENVGVIWS